MGTHPEWLPAPIESFNFPGDWDDYLAHIYKLYLENFSTEHMTFNGNKIVFKRYPQEKGKERTFWHVIEKDEIPYPPRMARVCWIRPLLENAFLAPKVKIWENQRKSDTRTVIWYEDLEYCIILTNRTGYYVFWTAYLLDEPHSSRRFQKEYDQATVKLR